MPYPNALAQANPQRNLLAAQMLPATGEGSYLRQQFPQVYGFLGGLAGTAPDEMQGSAMDPNTAAVRQGASYGYLPGLVASSAPLGKVGAGMGMLAGMARGTQKFDNSALMAGKALAKIDQITGLPLNADGTVTLFHHTNKNAAQSIQKTGVLKSAGEPSVYLTTERTPTTGYGDTVVSVKVNPSKLNLDDEFPNGRLDFSIDVGKPGGSVKVAPVPSFVYPQDKALRLAQQRASLPPAQGGLGLPAGNTPEQRAAAMGFDVNNALYHATDAPQDFSSIMPSTRGKLGAGVYTSPSAKYAEKYAGDNARTIPLVSRGNFINEDARIALQDAMHEKMFAQNPNLTVQDWRKATNQAISDAGYAGSDIASERVVTNPENLRSRFAAFDPLRKTAAIAAAAGLAAPDLLAGQSPQQAPKFDNSALMK